MIAQDREGDLWVGTNSGAAGTVKKAYVLSNRAAVLAVTQGADTITIQGPAGAPDRMASVIVLEK